MRKILLILSVLMFVSVNGQNRVSQKIMEIGKTDNRTMQHLDVLTNRIGGRVIGSDAYENATYWVAGLLESWGVEVEIEEVGELPVGFNRGPWFGKMYADEVTSLDFVTPSYTSGTKGVQRGHVVIEPKNRKEFDRIKGTLKGAWVLIEGQNTGFPINQSAEGDSIRASLIRHNEQIAHDSLRKYEPAMFYKEMVEAGILGIIQSAPVPLTANYDRQII